jgi:probable phosphoglycerate mutase
MNRCSDPGTQSDKPVTTFGVIRHAETAWNREKRIQGHQDSPLTQEGEMRADRWGLALRAFHWDRILASDTGRAVATASRINAYLQVPLEVDSRLRELDWGCWTAKTVAQLRQEEGEMLAIQERAGWDFQPPQGESRRSQLARCRQALREAAGRTPGDSILVVTHGGVIKCLAHGLPGSGPLAADEIGAHSYRLYWVAAVGGRLSLDGLNALVLP